MEQVAAKRRRATKNALRVACLIPLMINASCRRLVTSATQRLFPTPSPVPTPVFQDGADYNPNLPLGQWLVAQPVRLKFLKPSVTLSIVYPPHSGSVGTLILRITTPEGQARLSSLEELKGFVRIENTGEALDFVRLRTSFTYEGVWPQEDIDEVVMLPKSESPRSSGTYGVLSPQAYRIGQFQSASVKKMKEKYQIVRWVCSFTLDAPEARVQKWRETVSPDGAYSREILIDKPAPQLPDTRWGGVGRA